MQIVTVEDVVKTILHIGTKLEKMYPEVNKTYRKPGDLYNFSISFKNIDGKESVQQYWTGNIYTLNKIIRDFDTKYHNRIFVPGILFDEVPRPEREWHSSRWTGQYIKFCHEMFSPGTQFMCEELSLAERNKVYTAVNVSNNGVDSWVIETGEPEHELSGMMLKTILNIAHVTSIVTPGKGKVVITDFNYNPNHDILNRIFSKQALLNQFPDIDVISAIIWKARDEGQYKSKHGRKKLKRHLRRNANRLLQRKKLVVAQDKAFWDSMYAEDYGFD